MCVVFGLGDACIHVVDWVKFDVGTSKDSLSSPPREVTKLRKEPYIGTRSAGYRFQRGDEVTPSSEFVL